MQDVAPRDAGAREWLQDRIVVVGLVMVLAQTALRGWSQSSSWFFTDDYRLLLEATDEPLTVGYLVEPFDSQFMPFGRLLSWLVAHSEAFDWALAASLVVVLQAAAGVACLWMLTVLFGRRWEVLLLLGVYLTSAIPVPAFMWWAAAVNQVPMQLMAFVAIGFWVQYLRTRRWSPLLLTVGAVLLGLMCYVKMLLVLPVLAFMALAYFVSGGPWSRLRATWDLYRPAVLLGLLTGVGYVAHYLWRVPQPFEDSEGAAVLEVLDAMLGQSLTTGALGGPWRWWETTPPIVLASPPEVTIRLAWVVVVLVVGYSVLRRHNAGRAWLLVSLYASAAFGLLATSRGQLFGVFAGLEYRYLTDVVVVLVLGVGLAFLELPGAPGSSRERAAPLLSVKAPRSVVIGLTAVVAVGGLVSTVRYVGYWHEDNASAEYTDNLVESLSPIELPAVADGLLPEEVMPAYTSPNNELSTFVRLTGQDVAFPSATRQIHFVDETGTLSLGEVDPRVDSGPGPEPDCGWRVTGNDEVRVPLGTTAFPWSGWMRVGYLASGDVPVEVTVGERTVRTEVVHGLNDLFVQVRGIGDSVVFSGLPAGATLCVDRVEVGPLTEATGDEP